MYSSAFRQIGWVLTFCWVFFCGSAGIYGQGTIQEFGKNRVQFSDDFKYWNQYESQNFITYYYGKARGVVDAVVQMAESNNEDIRKILEYRFNEKVEIIVYANITDFKQSNIGNEEVFGSAPGETKIVGNKMFVYFTGDHAELQRQVREGIARVYLEQMQVGSSLQEFVQNAVNSDLPSWYVLGMVSFIGEHWNANVDNQARQILLSDEYKDFYGLARDHPKLAGHLFWYYIEVNYGDDVIANLLYLNRINRRLESSFTYSLGTNLDAAVEKCFEFFKGSYQAEAAELEELPLAHRLDIKNKRGLPFTEVALHPDGRQLAYVTNEIGQYKVYIQDARGNRKRLEKHGWRNPFQVTDYDNPILRWSKDGNVLAMIYERRDKRYLKWWNFRTDEKGKIKMDPKLEQIYSFDFLDQRNIILSGSERGMVDLYKFNLRNRSSIRLTEDYYDDHDVQVVEFDGRVGVLFASNRNSNRLGKIPRGLELPANNYDLYFMDITEDSERIDRLTRTPEVDERKPFLVDNQIYYTALHSGFRHLFKGNVFQNIDTVGTQVELTTGRIINLAPGKKLLRIDPRLVKEKRPWIDTVRVVGATNLTNYGTHITEMSVAGDQVAFAVPYRFTHLMFQMPLSDLQAKELKLSIYEKEQKTEQKVNLLLQKEAEKAATQPQEKQKPISNYSFQSRFPDPPGFQQRMQEKMEDESLPSLSLPDLLSASREPKEKPLVGFNSARAIAYRLKFRFESFTTNVDNEPLFGGLNTFAGMPQGFGFPPPGLLGKFTVSDLFEDYEITAGLRIPTTFNGAEYFMYYDDKKFRWDKRYALYRRSQTFSMTDNQNRPLEEEFTNLIGIYQLRFPLDIYRSFRLTTTLRFDTYNQLSTDRTSLAAEPVNTQRIGLKAEYVFDNTYLMMKNMLNGTRYKFWIEGMNKFQIQFAPWAFSASDDFMTIIGFDARHYLRLGRYAVLAGRAAGTTSFGSEQLLFFMGGVDNWLFAQNNNNIGIPPDGNFAFETLAANLRGFKQNARNGASYALINGEIRVAPFNYLSKKRLRSDFLRNFQLVGFVDVGTAWFGLSPFSEENPLNTVVLESPPTVSVRVNYFRDPIVVGVGGGVRLDLFGYFLRLDYAWGYETKRWQDPILYFSLGQDF